MAQLVEHHLAKVRVASSNLVIRSNAESPGAQPRGILHFCDWPRFGRTSEARTVLVIRSNAKSPGFSPGSSPVYACQQIREESRLKRDDGSRHPLRIVSLLNSRTAQPTYASMSRCLCEIQ